tara:strand:- start:14101 stop:19374 length:5274 start_codon:yes stop_codon:yes gene_type:complete
MDDLKEMVRGMVRSGASDEAIREAVKQYKANQANQTGANASQEVTATEAPTEPVKKKEATVSQSTPVEEDSSSDGSTSNKTIDNLPEQPLNQRLVNLYDNYKKAGKIQPAQLEVIETKIKAQKKGERGFWENAIASTEGFLSTGVAVPLFQYDSKEDLIAKREAKNKIDFLSDLSEEELVELKTFSGKQIETLEKENLNILFQNKMMKEKSKSLVNELKSVASAVKQMQERGEEIPEQTVKLYEERRQELQGMDTVYNENVDALENNNEDILDFYGELDLLKRNYGGLDYYADLARITTAGMINGVAQFAISTDEMAQDKLGVNLLTLTDDEDKARISKDLQAQRDEIARQQELQRPATSVGDIDSMESFGRWLGEQVATQLPVLSVLAVSGGTAGLGALGVSTAGAKVGELEDGRRDATQTIEELNAVLNSGQSFSEEEVIEIENRIEKAKAKSEITKDEMYIAGLGSGALEIITEKVSLGVLSKGKRAYIAAKGAGEKSLKEFTRGVGKTLVAGAGNGLEEGGAEFLNAVGGNLIDIMYLNDSDTHIFDGAIDALASGNAMGAGMRVVPSVVGFGVKTLTNRKKTDKIQAATQKLSDILAEIEVNAEEVDADTKQLLKKKANELKKEIAKDIKEVYDNAAEMSEEDLTELVNLDKKANKIRSRVEGLKKNNINKKMKAELILDLKADIDAIATRKQEILDYNSKEARQERAKEEARLAEEVKAKEIEAVETELNDLYDKQSALVEEGKGIESDEYNNVVNEILEKQNTLEELSREGSSEVQGEAGANTGTATNATGSQVENVVRTFRIINPFKTGKPLAEISLPESLDGTLDAFNRKIVDRFFSIKKLQSNIEAKLGRGVDADKNFRQAEILMHSRTASKMKQFAAVAESLVRDMANSELQEAEGRGKSGRFSDYLMARHAQERNTHIRNLELKDPDTQEPNNAGSGMTDLMAQAYLHGITDADVAKAEVSGLYTTEQIQEAKDVKPLEGKELEAAERLAERVDTILEETRQIMLEGGLITELQKDVLSNYYANYVPLQGYESENLEGDMATAFGMSLSVKGKEMKRAAGRTTKADNVLANIIGMRNSMVVRAEKNLTMQSLYNLAKDNPDTGIWKTFSKMRPDFINGLTTGGKVGQVNANMDSKNYVGVKFEGVQHYIWFANQHMANTLNAASLEKTDKITKLFGKFNRYLSTVLTTYNPEFAISNSIRDVQTAMINLASEKDIAGNTLNGKDFRSGVRKSTLPAIKTIFNSENGKQKNTELDRYYEEFKQDGAKTDWFYAKDIQSIKKDIEKMANREAKGKTATSVIRKGIGSIGNFMDVGNTAIENGVRLAAYMEARKAGVDRYDAAEMAKELTINFNQKGEYGTLLNTMFLFFNASVQGTVRFAKAMTTLKKEVQPDGTTKYGLNAGQKVAGILASASATATMINILFSGEDEDGVPFFNKIPDYEKERNFIVMDPTSDKGEYFKVPLPYGYNIFHNAGSIGMEVAMGTRSAGDGAGFMVNSLVGAFNPIGLSKSETVWGTMAKVAPTFLKPIIELAINENYFGSTIYNENFPSGTPKPESTLARPSTNEYLVDMTKFLNEATHGSDYVPGYVDINADKVEHILEFLGGGTLKFLNNVSKAGKYVFQKASGEEVEIKASEVPMIRKLFGEPSAFMDKEIYMDRRVEIKQLYAEYKSNLKENRGKEKYDGVSTLNYKIKNVDKKLKRLREQMAKASDIEDVIKKSKRIKELREKEKSVIAEFNKTFNKLRVD